MRFQFCGNVSCPEWFLAESAILTKITAVKMKLVAQYIITNIIKKEDLSAKIFKLLEASGFSQMEINSTISCITFVIENASKYDVTDTILIKELIDLGLPKENCEYLTKTFKTYKEQLQVVYADQIMRVGEYSELNLGVSQFIVSDNVAPQKIFYGNQFIDAELKSKDINGQETAYQFLILPEKLNDLLLSRKQGNDIYIYLIDLEKAQKIMQKY